MKNFCKFLLPALVILLPACQREMDEPEEGKVTEGAVSIDVTIDQEDTRTTVSEMSGVISFSVGDRLVITDGEKNYTGITSSTSTTGMFAMEEGFVPNRYEDLGVFATYAGFPASMVADISLIAEGGVLFTLPASYTFSQVGGMDYDKAKVPCPMGGLYRAGGGISLKPVSSIIRFYITNVVEGTLTFTFPSPVTGKAWVCPASGDELSDNNLVSSCPSEIKTSELTDSGNTVVVYDVPATKNDEFLCITIPVPVGTVPRNIVVTNNPADGNVKRIASLNGSSQSLTRGHGYRFVNLSFDVPVIKEFSVSEHKTVAFSSGNLQYIGSASEPYWKFADFQWDFFGRNGQEGDGKNVDRDLFGWATSGYGYKYPYMTITQPRAYGPVISSGEWTADSAEWDWGVHNTISNGGSYTWHTLTRSEWQYLMEGRTCTPKYALARVAGVNGLILFPDEYSHPSGVAAINNADDNYRGYNDNTFDAASWSALESAGCVFLPAAGYFLGTNVSGPDGNYWSSTASISTHAFSFIFSNGEIDSAVSDSRDSRYSVRLVRNLLDTAVPTNFAGHEYVDMGTVTIGGVQKNLKWATCNVGAENPWGYGDYFAWGETEPKSSYASDWSNYFDTTDGGSTFTKYNGSGGKTVLDLEDDVARRRWGGTWRMPTSEEWEALRNTDLYTWEWKTNYLGYGKNGMLVTRNESGNSIFLPAAGSRYGANLNDAGSGVFYWSSSLREDIPSSAWYVYFSSDTQKKASRLRYCGHSVRPLTE